MPSQGVHVGKAAAGEVTHIPAYQPSTGSSFATGNRVKLFQEFFKVHASSKFVHYCMHIHYRTLLQKSLYVHFNRSPTAHKSLILHSLACTNSQVQTTACCHANQLAIATAK